MLHKKLHSILNQIPTKLRGKYIFAFNQKNANHEELLEQLIALINNLSQKILPEIIYPDLPVADKVDDIKTLIAENQVIVVAGETGSGKSTQLPKICLDMGFGKRGLIGHTQPRRLAARAIASRVADEIKSQSQVSYKIRFSDQTSDETLIKVMTDGVLLSEIKNDRYLSKYEVIIIDEAHERSLNIDFLMGCIKKILPFRPDLKIIITSATIDHNKFTKYFTNAKDISIEGRTYPVEIKYQDDDDFLELSLQERILYAIDDLVRGDILVFLPTERDIHETLAYLNKQELRFTEVLPLFSRLSNKEQNKIFNPLGSQRRIILATNVAETSLTVPRIKYVIDSGLVRISRYSYRTKVQRLPIEKISKASANQRSGRCGRVSAGVCIRLYSQEDFDNRKEFTDPEILRTNLASVILQMMYLGLGNIQDFPFIDEPDQRFVKDGYKLLFELKAIDTLSYASAKITADGHKMAIMPLDPKLARMIIEGYKQNCLKEIISIVSFLSVQDPRERPLNFQQKSDEKHGVDKDKNSDFIGMLNLANRLSRDLKELTNREKNDYFKKNFISPVRFNEWNDIYRQILETVHGFKWKLSNSSDLSYENIHKALLSGLLGNIGFNVEHAEYLGARGLKYFIFPGSSQFKKNPKWSLSSEIIETTKIYARNVAKIEPEWIEQFAEHLVKKNYDDPIWSKKSRAVIINERVSLYGLEIVSKRSIQYAKIDQKHAREIFIRDALINGEFETKADFFKQNLDILNEIDILESKSRRRDILVDDEVMFSHYDNVIPADVCCGVTFEKWVKQLIKNNHNNLVFDIDSLMQHDARNVTVEKYPDILAVGSMLLPLEYNFDPVSKNDGATVTVPAVFVDDINPAILEWGVYGFLYKKIVAYLRALPKNIRKHCVPVPNYAQAILEAIDFNKDRELSLKSVLAHHITRITGAKVDETIWSDIDLDNHLILNIKVIDESGKSIAEDKNIDEIKNKLQDFVKKPKDKKIDKIYYEWGFGDIEKTQNITEYGISIKVFNCLEICDDGVKISYKASEVEAIKSMTYAVKFLIKLQLKATLTQDVVKHNSLASLSNSIKINDSKNSIISKAIDMAFFTNIELPFTKADFDQMFDDGLKEFNKDKIIVEQLVSEILKYKQVLDKKLSIKKIPLNLIELYADIGGELELLFNSEYLSVPLRYLQRYKFYIEALENRLEKATQNLLKDRAYKIEIDDLRIKLNKIVSVKNFDKFDTNVTNVEFLIMELWISWYLQSVKTIEKVSLQKIIKAINDLLV